MKLVIRKPGRIVANAEVCGTLAARDGIKTGPGCPNGQDAYDGKIVVVTKRMRFIGGGQLNEATMPTAEVSRTLNCMHEAGRILVTNSNLGHVMPTLAAGMEKLGGDNQTIFGGGVRHGERRRTVAFNFELFDRGQTERIGCVLAQRARDWIVFRH